MKAYKEALRRQQELEQIFDHSGYSIIDPDVENEKKQRVRKSDNGKEKVRPKRKRL